MCLLALEWSFMPLLPRQLLRFGTVKPFYLISVLINRPLRMTSRASYPQIWLVTDEWKTACWRPLCKTLYNTIQESLRANIGHCECLGTQSISFHKSYEYVNGCNLSSPPEFLCPLWLSTIPASWKSLYKVSH